MLKKLSLLCLATLSSCTVPAAISPVVEQIPASLPVAVPNPSSEQHRYASQVYSEVNRFRREHGLSRVHRNSTLDQLAMEHSAALARREKSRSSGEPRVNHNGFNRRAIAARNALHMKSISENVAYSHMATASPEKTVKLWDASPAHRFAMRGKYWVETGVGVVMTSEGVYTTQLFAAKRHTPNFRPSR